MLADDDQRARFDQFARQFANWSGLQCACLTFDLDFAPEFMIREIVDQLRSYNVKATIFATHPSIAVDQLAEEEAIEIALHPNIYPGSTQGPDLESVIGSLRKSYPKAVGSRFHLLHHSYRDLASLGRLGFEYDSSSLRFNAPYLLPAWHPDLDLTLLTYFWEDGVCEVARFPFKVLELSLEAPGMKIFNFHPLNVYLNSADADARRRLLADHNNLPDISEKVAARYRRNECGAGSLLSELLEHLSTTGCRTVTASELARAYRFAMPLGWRGNVV